MRTVPCKYCGKETLCIDTGMCNNCYEVDGRVDEFAKTSEGRIRLYDAICEGIRRAARETSEESK